MRIKTVWVQYPDDEIALTSAIDEFADEENPEYMIEELKAVQKQLETGEIVAFRELYVSIKRGELTKLFKPRVIPVVQAKLKEKIRQEKRQQ